MKVVNKGVKTGSDDSSSSQRRESDRPGVRCNVCKERGHIAKACPKNAPGKSSSDDVVVKALSNEHQRQLGERDARFEKLKEDFEKLQEEQDIKLSTAVVSKQRLTTAASRGDITIIAPSGNSIEGFNFNFEEFKTEMRRAIAQKDAHASRGLRYLLLLGLFFFLTYITVFNDLGGLISVLPSWVTRNFGIFLLPKVFNSGAATKLVAYFFFGLTSSLRFILLAIWYGACSYLRIPCEPQENWFIWVISTVTTVLFSIQWFLTLMLYLWRLTTIWQKHELVLRWLAELDIRHPDNPKYLFHDQVLFDQLLNEGHFIMKREEISVTYGLGRWFSDSTRQLVYIRCTFFYYFWCATGSLILSAWYFFLIYLDLTPVTITASRFMKAGDHKRYRDLGQRPKLFKTTRIKRELNLTIPVGDQPLPDLRPDNMAFTKLKHFDPLYTEFCFSYSVQDRVEYKYEGVQSRGTMSLELFMQLTTPSIVNLIDDLESVKGRLNRAAQNFHGVNIDKFQSVLGEDVVNNTIECVWHYLCARLEDKKNSHRYELFYKLQRI